MSYFVCRTCGVQHAEPAAEPAAGRDAGAGTPPAVCRICADDRQYVPAGGQVWTTLSDLRAEGVTLVLSELESGLTAVLARPRVGIGQRGLLVCSAAGNVLWDAPGYLDDTGVAAVAALGGVAAVAVSHPHFYGVMVEWSRAFDGAPVLVAAADREWVARPDPAIRYWEGSHAVVPGVTLVQCGGHFPGSAVLHWADGAGGAGALLTGDTIQVVTHPGWVTFMYSYPNMLPLPTAAVRRVVDAVAPYRYERLYGAFDGDAVLADAPGEVARSAARYLHHLEH